MAGASVEFQPNELVQRPRSGPLERRVRHYFPSGIH
jgi:hypothetical protein